MERLTCWLYKGVAGIADVLDGKYTSEDLIDILVQRLAAYEDTGLEPERVEELALAERDGRLVMLPLRGC